MVSVLGSVELQRSAAARPLAILGPPGERRVLSGLRGTVAEEPGPVSGVLGGGPEEATAVESGVDSRGDWLTHPAENAITTSSIALTVPVRFTASLP
jgi:hypothetical protein